MLNGIWPASGDVPAEEDVIGGVSAIIWALTLLPLVKYVRDPINWLVCDSENNPGLHIFVLWHE